MGKRKKRRTLEELINEFKEVHGDEYIYDLVNFRKMKEHVNIVCRIHGVFPQTPQKHLYGQGCPICGNKKKNKDIVIKLEAFFDRANKKHNNKYIYHNYNIKSEHDIIDIICPKHGSFPQRIYDHLNGHGCPICGIQLSNAELELCNFIKSLGIKDFIRGERKLISPYEIDIYIPSLKIGIEYNGLKWHSEQYKTDKLYHLNKLNMCNEKGIELIQIFEDEYINHKTAVLNKLKYLLTNEENSFKYDISVNEIETNIAKEFVEIYGIQDFSDADTYIGCYEKDDLIGVISLIKENNDSWKINQFVAKHSNLTNECFKELIGYFLRKHRSKTITNYADRRWITKKQHKLYNDVGFVESETIEPSFKYVVGNQRKEETSILEGFYRIWDCGYVKFVYKT